MKGFAEKVLGALATCGCVGLGVLMALALAGVCVGVIRWGFGI